MTHSSASPVFDLESTTINGKAQVKNGDFTVLQGSQARVMTDGSLRELISAHQRSLVERGVLVPGDEGGLHTFSQDAVFSNASEAACVLLGKSWMTSTSRWSFKRADGTPVKYGVWRDNARNDPPDLDAADLPGFELHSVGLTATAQIRGGRFVVLKGSQARTGVVQSFERYVPPGYRTLRTELIATGQLQDDPEGDRFIFENDVVFKGSSPAAAVILGRSADGTREWKRTLPDGTAQTHREYLAQQSEALVDIPYSFAWMPFFRTLATHLLDAAPEEALDAFRRAAGRMEVPKLMTKVAGLQGMDPVTGVSLAAWFLKPHMRRRWIALVAEELALDVALPEDDDDLRGLESTGPLENIILEGERQEERAWAYDLTRTILDGLLDEAGLAQALTHKHVKLAKVSQLLATIDPEQFALSRLLNKGRSGEPPVTTSGEYLSALAPYQGQSVWPTELLERQLASLVADRTAPQASTTADPLASEYQQFLADPVQQLRCAVRRVRSEQLRDALTADVVLTLEAFNRTLWQFESATCVDGQPVTRELFAGDLTPERAAKLAGALVEGRMELQGNYTWGSGASVFGSRLSIPDTDKEAIIAQAMALLSDETDPVVLAQQLDALPGFGPNVATGLTLLAHPTEFALYNRRSTDALRALNYDASSAEAFQTSAAALRDRVGAGDFLELDWFLYSRVSPQTTWWVNQGQTYREERAGGYVWASTESGRTLTHHEDVNRLKPGDRIIHYADQAIQAVSVVTAPPVEVGDEQQSSDKPEKRRGYLAHVEYQDLTPPRALRSIPAHLRQSRSGPFDKNGGVKQVYLSPVDAAVYGAIIHPPGETGTVWLVQADPEDDVAGRINPAAAGDVDGWFVTRHEKDMQIGDQVVLWRSGTEGGIYALGELTGPPDARVTPAHQAAPSAMTVPYRLTHVLKTPVRRSEIEAHPVLSQMQVLRVASGASFKLTAAEWEALRPLLTRDEDWKNAITSLLAASDEGLHVSVIAQRLAEVGNLPLGPSPERAVSHILSAFPEAFEPLGAGVYRLRDPDRVPYMPVPFEVIRQKVAETGLRIDDRTLRRYHVALQTRGFVILSGVSGTGKTWLAQAYAHAADAAVQVFPVAPNWTSNEDLLGFYSPLEGGHYHHTPFSRFLLEAGAEYRAAQQAGEVARPFHIVIDEMNLARVEYYFAQFLSKMELRAQNAGAEIDLGPGQTALLSPNVVVIGTVNVDATTHDFADKVYDRAQLIELPVTREQLGRHLEGHAQAETLLRIWDLLHPVAPFAFRVLDEVTAYQRAAARLDVDALEALDDALLQKVLPKLRGTDLRMLEALRGFVDLAKDDFPLSHAKSSRMLADGTRHGFVSFH